MTKYHEGQMVAHWNGERYRLAEIVSVIEKSPAGRRYAEPRYRLKNDTEPVREHSLRTDLRCDRAMMASMAERERLLLAESRRMRKYYAQLSAGAARTSESHAKDAGIYARSLRFYRRVLKDIDRMSARLEAAR